MDKRLARHLGLAGQQVEVEGVVIVFRLPSGPQFLPGSQPFHGMAGSHLPQQTELVFGCRWEGRQYRRARPAG